MSMPYLIPPLIMIFSKGFDTAGYLVGEGTHSGRMGRDGVSWEPRDIRPSTQLGLADNMTADDQGCDW